MRFLKHLIKKTKLKKMGLITNFPLDVSINTKVSGPVKIIERVKISPNVSIGAYTYIHSGYIESNTSIGSFCSISRNVDIAGSEHPLDRLTTSPVTYTNSYFGDIGVKLSKYEDSDKLKTVIGNDVWIGSGVIIKRGVKIGNGVIIASGSVVTKDVNDYSIVAGVPAKLIRVRQDLIERMQKDGDWIKNIGAVTNWNV